MGKSESVEWVEVPYERLDPDTLLNVISEFVTREWEEMGTVSYTLDHKIEKVKAQLKSGEAKLVFDLSSNTCNIIPGIPGNRKVYSKYD